jgi:hypothetical protein
VGRKTPIIIGLQDVIKNDLQRFVRHHPGIQLAHQSGGRVARIGKRLLTILNAGFVQFLEAGFGYEDFPADSQHGGKICAAE